jgi:hypothetical protein
MRDRERTPAKIWGRMRVLRGGYTVASAGAVGGGAEGVVGWMRLRAQGGGCGIPCVCRLGLFLVGILPRRRGDVLPSGLELRSSDLGPTLLADA